MKHICLFTIYVKSTVKMDVCLRDNLILFKCFAKTSKVNLQLPIVILKNQLFRHASSYHVHVHVGHINFQQTRVSRSVQTVHTNLFAKRRKLHKFATTNSNFDKNNSFRHASS